MSNTSDLIVLSKYSIFFAGDVYVYIMFPENNSAVVPFINMGLLWSQHG